MTALVTGGAGGLGADTCRALAAAGARVLLLDLANSAGAEVVAGINGVSGQPPAIFVPGDLADLASTAAQVRALADEYRGIDVLVNNAAIYPRKPFEQFTVEEHQAVQRVNVDAPFVCAQAVVPGMRANGSGRIINISSITAYGILPDLTAYVVSKAARIGLTRSLARDLGQWNITVNAIAPGAFPTPAEEMHDPEVYTQYVLERQALQRRGHPQDIADVVLFFASEQSSFVTGQLLNVDGGWVMQ